jgi:CBS domain-containing protein
LSNDIHFLLPIMLAVMIAKSIADTATHSLYHALLEVRCVPFLENDPVVGAVDTFKAKDVMSAPITTFRHKEKVRNIVQTLVSCRHHAFPVVLTPKDKQILDSRNKIRKQNNQEKLARTHRLTPSSPMASPSAFSSSRRVDSQLEGFDLTEIQVNIKEKEKEDDGRENGHRSNGHSERLGVTLGGSMTIDDLIEDTRGVRLRPLDLETDAGALALRQKGRGLLDGGGSSYRRRYEEDDYEDDKQHAVFKGLILRSQLEILLRHPEILVAHENDINSVLDYRSMKDEDTSHKSPIAISSPRYLETVQEEDMEKYIDLTPYINTSSLTVTENFSLGFTYNLFRSMGLRHLPVVNENNQPVGIITRKDLLGQTLEERLLVAKGGMPQPRACGGCFGSCC